MKSSDAAGTSSEERLAGEVSVAHSGDCNYSQVERVEVVVDERAVVVIFNMPVANQWLFKDSNACGIHIRKVHESGDGHGQWLVLASALLDECNVKLSAHLVAQFLAESVGVDAVEIDATVE